MNRSGLLSASVVQARHGGTGADALAYLETRRMRPMSNPVFIDYVRALPLATADEAR